MNTELLNRSGVYQIVNTTNGKRYVGSTVQFKKRKAQHFNQLSRGIHHSKYLQAAYAKYSKKAFRFEVLLVCDAEELLFYEQLCMDSLYPSYNISPTAGNTLGVRCDAERRRKIGIAHKGRKFSAEHRKKISMGGMGRTPSEETRERLREAAQKKAADPEWLRKVIAGKIGKPLSAAHKKALSKVKKGVPANLSEETRLLKNRKIAEANRRREITSEMRFNFSKGQRERCNVERFMFRGELRTVLSLAEEFSICRHVLRKRINMGWNLERAVTQPPRKLK